MPEVTFVPSNGEVADELLLATTLTDVAVVLLRAAPHAIVFGRIKSSSSAREKAERLGMPAGLPFDAIGVRVLVNTHEQCRHIVERLHHRFRWITGEYDDYIQAPKTNGYQSLHTTLLNGDGHPFEVQVRTHEMHTQAEHGDASHGRYKQLQAKTRPVARAATGQDGQDDGYG